MATRKWTDAGDLVIGRAGHNVIYDGQFLLVVGGEYGYTQSDFTVMTEKCSIFNNGREMACASQTPELTDYSDYPELFLVSVGYCTESA